MRKLVALFAVCLFAIGCHKHCPPPTKQPVCPPCPAPEPCPGPHPCPLPDDGPAPRNVISVKIVGMSVCGNGLNVMTADGKQYCVKGLMWLDTVGGPVPTSVQGAIAWYRVNIDNSWATLYFDSPDHVHKVKFFRWHPKPLP